MATHKATIDHGGNERSVWFTWTCTCGKRGGKYAYPRKATAAKKAHLARNR